MCRLLKDNLYNRERLIRLEVDLDQWLPQPQVLRSLEIRRDGLRELDRFRETWTEGLLPQAFYADKIFGLSQVWLGLWESSVAHISWTTSRVTTVKVPLEPGSVELRDCHTLAAYRGRRIGSHVVGAVLGDLKREGVSTVVAHVGVENAASCKMMARAGFEPVETLTSMRLAGFVRVSRKPHSDAE